MSNTIDEAAIVLYKELGLPEEFWEKRSKRASGAYGPGFFVTFKHEFEESKNVAEVFHFLNKRGQADKGVAIYIEEESAWLIFTFRKFSQLSKEEPKRELIFDTVD